MKIKTNIRAGSGGSSTDTSTSTSSGGANSGGVKSGKATDVVAPPVYYSRCVGI